MPVRYLVVLLKLHFKNELENNYVQYQEIKKTALEEELHSSIQQTHIKTDTPTYKVHYSKKLPLTSFCFFT